MTQPLPKVEHLANEYLAGMAEANCNADQDDVFDRQCERFNAAFAQLESADIGDQADVMAALRLLIQDKVDDALRGDDSTSVWVQLKLLLQTYQFVRRMDRRAS